MRSLDPTEDFAIQLVRRFLVLCEHPRTRERMLRIVERSSQSGDDAPRILRWLNRAVLLPHMRRGTRPMSTMKWELVVSQLFGMAMTRYLLELEPIASADRDEVVAMVAPGVVAVLQAPTGPSPASSTTGQTCPTSATSRTWMRSVTTCRSKEGGASAHAGRGRSDRVLVGLNLPWECATRSPIPT